MNILYKLFKPKHIKKLVEDGQEHQKKLDQVYWEGKIKEIKEEHKLDILSLKHKYETEIKSLKSEVEKWERRKKKLKEREYDVRIRARENLHVSTRIVENIEEAGLSIMTVVGSMKRIKDDAESVTRLLTKE